MELYDLPDEVLKLVFHCLTPYDLARVARTCRRFKALLHDHLFSGYQGLCLQHCLSAYGRVPRWLVLNVHHWAIMRQDHLPVLRYLADTLLKRGREMKLESLSLGRECQPHDSNIYDVARMGPLLHLTVKDCRRISPSGFVNLGQLSRLQSLSLTNVQCGDMPLWTTLTSLTSVFIDHSNTLVDASFIAALPVLEQVALSHCPMLAHITLTSPLERLQRVSLGGCRRVDDSTLEFLACCPGLVELDLTDCFAVTGTGLQPVMLPKIEILSVAQCPFLADVALANVARLTTLVELDLEVTPDTARSPATFEKALSKLAALARLESLNLSGRLVSKTLPEFSFISALTALQSLTLVDCALTAGHCGHLRRLPALVRLDVSGCRYVDNECLRSFGTLPKLQDINIVGCVPVTNQGLAHLAHCRHLRRIALRPHARLSRSAFKAINPRVAVLEYGAR